MPIEARVDEAGSVGRENTTMASKEVLNSAAYGLYFEIVNNLETTGVDNFAYVVPVEVAIYQASELSKRTEYSRSVLRVRIVYTF